MWEIIAGELMLQRSSSLVGSPGLLLEQGEARAAEAARLTRSGDLDNAGHAMIGCALALAHAALAEGPGGPPVEHHAADLAARIAWEAHQPDPAELERLAEAIHAFAAAEQPDAARRIMDLAIRAGGYAAGFSSQISRRRQRRDLLEPSAGGIE